MSSLNDNILDTFDLLTPDFSYDILRREPLDREIGTAVVEPDRDSDNELERTEITERLPLLRASDIVPGANYDRDNPTCIHYDLKIKVSVVSAGKVRAISAGQLTRSDEVLAPSDLWENELQEELKSLRNSDKFSADSNYTCQGTVAIKARSTRSGLNDDIQGEDIPWCRLDKHLESLGLLFKLRRMQITVHIELTYKEVTTADGTSAKQRKSATSRARSKMPADAVFMTRVYQHFECNAKQCRHYSMYCLKDDKGNHVPIERETMREVYEEIKKGLKEDVAFEEVERIEMPPAMRRKILRAGRKRKATSNVDCRSSKTHLSGHSEPLEMTGDPAERLEQYCTWSLNVQSDRYRSGMEAAGRVAMEEMLDLYLIQKSPDVVTKMMQDRGVQTGAVLRFIHNVQRFIESCEESETED